MKTLKEKILDINKRIDIDCVEKNRLINLLMKSQYNKQEIKNIACSHYKRNCKIECFECKKIYPCRFCHDEYEDHTINRFEIKNMVCNFCDKLQECSKECLGCKKSMSDYYCDICKLFSDNLDTTHCNKCGICRIGKDIKHCDKCNMCYNSDVFDSHKCVNVFDSICPICQEDIKTSREITSILDCNHIVHVKCLQQSLLTNNYQCPLCKKSMTDMTYVWRQLDDYVSNTEMPEEYSNMYSNILCNDCLEKSEVKYHFVYNKCLHCSGWNTTVLDSFRKN